MTSQSKEKIDIIKERDMKIRNFKLIRMLYFLKHIKINK